MEIQFGQFKLKLHFWVVVFLLEAFVAWNLRFLGMTDNLLNMLLLVVGILDVFGLIAWFIYDNRVKFG